MANSAESKAAASPAVQPAQAPSQENFADYVAELQLHMTLQARNLVPSFHQQGQTSRSTLLHETQALVEKQISRQV